MPGKAGKKTSGTSGPDRAAPRHARGEAAQRDEAAGEARGRREEAGEGRPEEAEREEGRPEEGPGQGPGEEAGGEGRGQEGAGPPGAREEGGGRQAGGEEGPGEGRDPRRPRRRARRRPRRPSAAARPSILEGRTKHGKNTVICPLSGFEVTPGPANLGAKTLDRLRQKLIDEKQRLLHQADDLSAEAEQLAREREAGDTQFDEESGEGDTVNVERERDLLLSATARQVVEEIDDALDRMKRNKYGVCKPAGRKIALERLEAIPWAQVCVDCKARAERRR